LAEPEAQLPLEDVGELLVLVLVARHDAPLLQIDLRQHHPVGRDQPAAEERVERVLRQVLPAVVSDAEAAHLLPPVCRIDGTSDTARDVTARRRTIFSGRGPGRGTCYRSPIGTNGRRSGPT